MSGEVESVNVGVYGQFGAYQINPTISTNGITINFVIDANAGVTGQVVVTGRFNQERKSIGSRNLRCSADKAGERWLNFTRLQAREILQEEGKTNPTTCNKQ